MIRKIVHKPIFSGFASNTRFEDTFAALQLVFLPWQWQWLQKGVAVQEVEENISSYLGVISTHVVDSGRTALLISLKAAGVQSGDEVIVQAYTCMVVINAIRWSGATPVYIDIAADACLDPLLVEKAITDKTTVIIAQHTFGQAAPLSELVTLSDKHNLVLIEDCAHTFGGTTKDGTKLGTVGDMAIFSFGSDKVISTVRGGCIVVNNAQYETGVQNQKSRLPQMARLLIIKHLLYLIVFPAMKPLYHFGIGKIVLWACHRLHVFARLITQAEKIGRQSTHYPATYPNAFACVLEHQLAHVEETNKHRKAIASIYEAILGRGLVAKQAVPMQWIIEMDNPQPSVVALKKAGIHLSQDWNGAVIVPKGITLEITGYQQGSCPKAENLCKRVLQLPTHRGVSKAQATRIAKIIQAYV